MSATSFLFDGGHPKLSIAGGNLIGLMVHSKSGDQLVCQPDLYREDEDEVVRELRKEYLRSGRRQAKLKLDGPAARKWVMQKFGQCAPGSELLIGDEADEENPDEVRYDIVLKGKQWKCKKMVLFAEGNWAVQETANLPPGKRYKQIKIDNNIYFWDEGDSTKAPLSVGALFNKEPAAPEPDHDDVRGSGEDAGDEDDESEEALDDDDIEDEEVPVQVGAPLRSATLPGMRGEKLAPQSAAKTNPAKRSKQMALPSSSASVRIPTEADSDSQAGKGWGFNLVSRPKNNSRPLKSSLLSFLCKP